MNNIRIELKWAIIFSIVGLLWMLIERVTGMHDQYLDYHMYLTNIFAIPAIYIMVAALREKKKKFYQGKITYLQGLKSGTILSVFIALLSPLTQWITTYVISPDYFANAIKRSVAIGYFPDEAAATAHFNFPNYVTQGLIGALIMGIATTAIAMIFLRTKQRDSSDVSIS